MRGGKDAGDAQTQQAGDGNEKHKEKAHEGLHGCFPSASSLLGGSLWC